MAKMATDTIADPVVISFPWFRPIIINWPPITIAKAITIPNQNLIFISLPPKGTNPYFYKEYGRAETIYNILALLNSLQIQFS